MSERAASKAVSKALLLACMLGYCAGLQAQPGGAGGAAAEAAARAAAEAAQGAAEVSASGAAGAGQTVDGGHIINRLEGGEPASQDRGDDQEPANPWPHGYMVTTANPMATEAAALMLDRGGHAVDAAIAAHAVLGLVEPESSGIGGGGFMLVYEPQTPDAVRFFDGRESAPAAARADMFMVDGEMQSFLDATEDGDAVGVPGTVALYQHVHDIYGRLPWADLFAPAIELAEEGFEVPSKLASYLPMMARRSSLEENPGSGEYFYPQGEPLQSGAVIYNPEYADTLRQIARQGAAAFYRGNIAEAVVAAAQAGDDGGSLTLADMAAYQVIERPSRCGAWRTYRVCAATPPSSGVMQIMLVNLYDRLLPDDSVGNEPLNQNRRLRAFVDAQRLAYADRDHYFGDPDHVQVPIEQLLDPRYLDQRAAQPVPAGGTPEHGDPSAIINGSGAVFSPDSTEEPAGTTHLSIVDAEGNAVSATMTVAAFFGSKRWAAGFLLNNDMTNFARFYDPAQPEPANMVRPGARPRSSMSPTIVLDDTGDLFMVTGSPGGNSIPAYTAKSLITVVDWGWSAQEAVDFPNIIAPGETVRVETGREPGEDILIGLQEYGYEVEEVLGESSGLHVIVVREDGMEGAADPRRLGNVVSGGADGP